MTETDLYDLTIIGGGPIGMFAAYYAGMRQAKVQLLESLPDLGGQVAALYPLKTIYDIAGFPAIEGKQLVHSLEKQLTTFQPTIHTETAVQNFTQQADGTYQIDTNNGTYYSKAIIIAIGNGAFEPRRLAFDYDPSFDQKYVFYAANHPDEFAGKTVAVAGGGDSAIDLALTLEPIAKKVYLIHRRNQFRGLESNVAKLEASSVELKTPFLLKQLSEQDDQLHIALNEVKADHTEDLAVDRLVVNYGFTADTKLLRSWGLALEHRMIKVDTEMKTNLPNVYAIGDTVQYPGKLKLIASGFGEAPIAVSTAMTTLYPDKRQPLHSTDIQLH
ncbi:trxB1 protein [Lactobacillus selangorensis]|uniref:Ferredoxin--NADP reductase n=1 Tax=Lactobacillus selangorensis TaxID=81857 RepID=A0A0R2FFV5_9LACO|nr:NAD(P)/FAD-dependent oxidoreductase [Lactobacillus selangorensis]KRN27489.1 trxB1 protein [Lactobacillus selangorensis]KRN31314.1 trxB1 protein [Lactobacillus selangorensis]